MNVFKILVGFLVAVYLIFFITNILFPTAFPKDDVIKDITKQIEYSKKNLGLYNSKYNLKFEQGISLTKQDFSEKDLEVEFECTSLEYCCAENEKCGDRIEWSRNMITFNKPVNPTVSTRCEEVKGIFFCKIFFGQIPAQVKLEEFNYNNNFYFDSEKLKIDATVKNIGSTTENFAAIETKVFVIFYEAGEKKEQLAKEITSNPEKIQAKETKTLYSEIQIDSPGEYLIKSRITGLDFGYAEREYSINVFGNPGYECKTDETRKEILIDPNTVAEGKIVECDIKYFCSDCLYAFECKYVWTEKFPKKTLQLGTNDYVKERSKGTHCR